MYWLKSVFKNFFRYRLVFHKRQKLEKAVLRILQDESEKFETTYSCSKFENAGIPEKTLQEILKVKFGAKIKDKLFRDVITKMAEDKKIFTSADRILLHEPIVINNNVYSGIIKEMREVREMDDNVILEPELKPSNQRKGKRTSADQEKLWRKLNNALMEINSKPGYKHKVFNPHSAPQKARKSWSPLAQLYDLAKDTGLKLSCIVEQDIVYYICNLKFDDTSFSSFPQAARHPNEAKEVAALKCLLHHGAVPKYSGDDNEVLDFLNDLTVGSKHELYDFFYQKYYH